MCVCMYTYLGRPRLGTEFSQLQGAANALTEWPSVLVVLWKQFSSELHRQTSAENLLQLRSRDEPTREI